METFIPGWGQALSPVISIAADHLFSAMGNSVTNDANSAIGRLQDQTMLAANLSTVQQLYKADPGIVPANIASQGDAAVGDYLAKLANPFADPGNASDFPTAKQREVVDQVLHMDDHIKDAFTNQNSSLGI
jgi:hypothetical protein